MVEKIILAVAVIVLLFSIELKSQHSPHRYGFDSISISLPYKPDFKFETLLYFTPVKAADKTVKTVSFTNPDLITMKGAVLYGDDDYWFIAWHTQQGLIFKRLVVEKYSFVNPKRLYFETDSGKLVIGINKIFYEDSSTQYSFYGVNICAKDLRAHFGRRRPVINPGY